YANWDKYVDPYYTVKKFKEVYALELAPVPDRDEWIDIQPRERTYPPSYHQNGLTYNHEENIPSLLSSNVLLEDLERIELLQLEKEDTSVRNVVGMDIVQKRVRIHNLKVPSHINHPPVKGF
ncbi:transposase, MuDR, partial [Tanacetum coccineum]